MMPLLRHPYTHLAVRVFLGLFFIFAAIPKIAQPDAFAHNILNYQILPLNLVNAMALVMPWLELLVGLGLVLGIRVRACGLWCSAMMTVFTIALLIALAKGLKIDCGCFDQESSDTIGGWTVLRDLGLLALSLYCVFVRPSGRAIALEQDSAPGDAPVAQPYETI